MADEGGGCERRRRDGLERRDGRRGGAVCRYRFAAALAAGAAVMTEPTVTRGAAGDAPAGCGTGEERGRALDEHGERVMSVSGGRRYGDGKGGRGFVGCQRAEFRQA